MTNAPQFGCNFAGFSTKSPNSGDTPVGHPISQCPRRSKEEWSKRGMFGLGRVFNLCLSWLVSHPCWEEGALPRVSRGRPGHGCEG